MCEEKAGFAKLAILMLAAGRSARMGDADKLLQPVAGTSLLRHLALQAVGTGLDVHVALPDADRDRHAALDGLRLTIVDIPDPDAGMGRSLAIGVGALPAGCRGVMVIPADLPDLTTADFTSVAAQFDSVAALRATAADGAPGHPVIFPARLFSALAALRGDTGARHILATEKPRLVALPGRHATTDLDTPADWAAWRTRNPEK